MTYPTADTFIKGIPRGMTLPQLFKVRDVGMALVKFQQNPQGNRVLTNELIGFEIARLLGLECPQVGIVNVDETVLPEGGLWIESPLYPNERFAFKPGLHVGCISRGVE